MVHPRIKSSSYPLVKSMYYYVYSDLIDTALFSRNRIPIPV